MCYTVKAETSRVRSSELALPSETASAPPGWGERCWRVGCVRLERRVCTPSVAGKSSRAAAARHNKFDRGDNNGARAEFSWARLSNGSSCGRVG